MPRRTLTLTFAAGMMFAASSALPQSANSPTSQWVSARLLGEEPSEKLVRKVAEVAHSTVLTPEDWPHLEERTIADVVTELCGSVQPGYLDLLKTENLGGIQGLETVVGPAAYGIRWPACLYVTRNPLVTTHLLGRGEAPSQVMEKLTGYGKPDPVRRRKFFGTADPRLLEGETVSVEFATAPQFLRPKVPLNVMQDLLAKEGKVAVRALEIGGTIVGPTQKDCDSSRVDYPFRPEDVIAAFRWTSAKKYLYPVHVAVVDNGFFGVPCRTGDCPAVSQEGHYDFQEPFSSIFFDEDRFQDHLGPLLSEGRGALNYKIGAAPPAVNLVSGHGTHVAGITIGGEKFYPVGRDIYKVGQDGWLKLIIVKLSEGTLDFPRDAAEKMFLLLREAGHVEVVNLSLAIAQSDGNFIKTLVDDANWRNVLFVAAAGNDTSPVRSRNELPAVLGGPDSTNVMTIGSVDASGKLSAFSNWDAKKVDLVAPGCKIRSWLTNEGPPIDASGTSQAAAIVTFGASMMRALWPLGEAHQIKNRLIYSGSLIDPADRGRTAHGLKLDLFKSLLIRHDFVRMRNAAGAERLLVGKLRTLRPWLQCEDGDKPEWQQIRSFKRDGAGAVLFTVDNKKLSSCSGTLQEVDGPVTNEAFLEKPFEYSNGKFTAVAEEPIATRDIQEFVLSEH